MEWLRKDEQVAQALRELLIAGEWVDVLPGYRKLERRFKVNRVTLERAMQRLTDEGMLAAAEAGKRRRILHRAETRAEERKVSSVLVIGPRPLNDYSPTYRSLLSRFFQVAESEGWKVNYESLDFSFPRKSITQTERLIADYQPVRVVFVSASAALVQWMATKAKIACFTFGGEVTGWEDRIDCVASSFGELVCAAASMIRRYGHRRLLIPMVSGRSQLRDNVIAISAAAWAQDVPRVELEAMVAEQGEWLPDVLHGFWPKAFARLKPTAVIVKETNEYLSLLSYAYQRGIRIPEQLSVVLLSGDPSCKWLNPMPDRLEWPTEKFVRVAVDWLSAPVAKQRKFEFIASDYIRGGTLAGVPQQ